MVGGYFEELIPQNTTVPTSRSKDFTTVRDNQTAVKILVLQGSRPGRKTTTSSESSFSPACVAPLPGGDGAGDLRDQRGRDRQRARQGSGDGQGAVDHGDGDQRPHRRRAPTDGQRRQEFAVARRADENLEQAKQEAETLIAEIEGLFPEVERVVAGSDFGRDAIDKARSVVDRSRTLMEQGDADGLKEQLEALARTQRMFKGVVGKAT